MTVSLAKSEFSRSATLADVSDRALVRMLATLEIETEAVSTARTHVGEYYGRHCSVYVDAGVKLDSLGHLLASVHRERVARMIPAPLIPCAMPA